MRTVVVESKINVVVWPVPAASSAATTTTTASAATSAKCTKESACAKVVDDAKIHAVAIVVERGHVMKVLSCTGKVRQRNETQKRLRRQTNLGCRNHVASEGLSGLWIKDLHWQSAVESGGKLRGGEISIALSRRGNGREDIIRIRDTRQREAAEPVLGGDPEHAQDLVGRPVGRVVDHLPHHRDDHHRDHLRQEHDRAEERLVDVELPKTTATAGAAEYHDGTSTASASHASASHWRTASSRAKLNIETTGWSALLSAAFPEFADTVFHLVLAHAKALGTAHGSGD